jgi:hypothetical protein
LEFSPFENQDVAAIFAALSTDLRPALMRLRQLVLDTAAHTANVGELIETLKWGEPAYLPAKARTGTTIRINALRGSRDRYALFVPCQTSLVETWRRRYSEIFTFEGNRAILFRIGHDTHHEPLAHCIAMALTYHRHAGP